MENEQFDPKMEAMKAILRFFARTLDGVAKEGVSLSLAVCGCFLIYFIMNDRLHELRGEILTAKRDWSDAMNEERRTNGQIQDALEHCNHEREKLAVEFSALRAQFEIFKRKKY